MIGHVVRRLAGSAAVGLALSLAWVGPASAALFEDDEARKAILELRQRVDANRQASEAALQRILDAQRTQAAAQNALQAEALAEAQRENATLRRSLIALQNQIEAMRADLARFTGFNEQLVRDLSELQRRQKDLAQGQADLTQGQANLTQGQANLGRVVEDRVRQLEPQKVTVDGRDILVEPAERRAFDAALASFRAGDFAGAQTGFLSLLARFPRSGYLPSALFWLGNAQYATRDYKEAITNFRTMLQGAPEHPRAAEALLSIANCQIELKDARGARRTLDDLIKAHPQSEAAQAGKERLAKLR